MTSFWLANTSRLLHCLKQYSGDEVIQSFFYILFYVNLAANAKILNSFVPSRRRS